MITAATSTIDMCYKPDVLVVNHVTYYDNRKGYVNCRVE